MTAKDGAAWTPEERAKRLRMFQIRMFVATWLTYATFYLTRKNYSVAQPAFMADLGWDKTDVGIIITTFLTVYAIGQFANGVLCDRFGPRIMIAIGFGVTAAVTVGLGLASTIALMVVLYGINGYAQSIGWPAVTKAMTSWIPVSARGRVMGIWGTNYPVGDAVATGLAAALLGSFGWRAAFFVPALISIVIGVGIVIVFRNHPRDVGLASGSAARAGGTSSRGRWIESIGHLANSRVITLGVAYLCLKFVRYTFLFWIGIYLVESLSFDAEEAGYLQVPFSLAGLAGSIAGGWLSDRVFGTRRAPAATVMLGGLIVSLIALQLVPGAFWLVFSTFALVGFFLFGPDMLISGTAAMDFGSEDAAATVAGFVNGMGSIGAALQGIVIGLMSESYGWSSVFYLLMVMVALCVAITATLWNETAGPRLAAA